MSDVSRDIDKPWRLWATAIVGGILAFGCLSGFVLLPVIQGYRAGVDPYTAICRALGILPGSPAAKQPVSGASPTPVSQVSWTPDVLRRLSSPDTAKGRELAASLCASCHGEQGLSTDPQQFPNMAGQSAYAIYKQLHDYKTGARKNELMQGVVAELGDEQMADVAAHFASLQQARWDVTWVQTAGPGADTLARTGDSARGLPACESCHSPRSGGPIETPVLFAQTKDYLATQMRAYKSGARANDVYQRMRLITAKLTDQEIDQLAQYYTERR
jgi:cytochrome c553